MNNDEKIKIMLKALKKVKAALDSGELMADPSRLISIKSDAFTELVKLVTEITVAIATGEER